MQILGKNMIYFRCIAAFIYDAIILIAVFMIFTAVCIFLRGDAIPPHSFWYESSLLLIFYLYYLQSYLKSGQTIGMRAWRIRLVSFDGQKLTIRQLHYRFLLIVPLFLSTLLYLKKMKKRVAHISQTHIKIV
jgi:uncharacterized RDD family membrane protein YckC